VYESRPDSRERHALYSMLVHQLRSGNILHLAYRYYEDDWEVSSNTVELSYQKKFEGGSFLEPHLRLYEQSAAFFYTHFLDSATHDAEDISTIPEFVSADYRLDEMQSYTVGVKYGTSVFRRGTLRFRAAYVDQTFADTEFPENDAVVLQLSLKNVFQ